MIFKQKIFIIIKAWKRAFIPLSYLKGNTKSHHVIGQVLQHLQYIYTRCALCCINFYNNDNFLFRHIVSLYQSRSHRGRWNDFNVVSIQFSSVWTHCYQVIYKFFFANIRARYFSQWMAFWHYNLNNGLAAAN